MNGWKTVLFIAIFTLERRLGSSIASKIWLLIENIGPISIHTLIRVHHAYVGLARDNLGAPDKVDNTYLLRMPR